VARLRREVALVDVPRVASRAPEEHRDCAARVLVERGHRLENEVVERSCRRPVVGHGDARLAFKLVERDVNIRGLCHLLTLLSEPASSASHIMSKNDGAGKSTLGVGPVVVAKGGTTTARSD